jgi:hypothetical protein
MYIYAEDFVGALVGPFDSEDDANTHIQLCKERGDGAEMRVVTDQEAADIEDANPGMLKMTVEDDATWQRRMMDESHGPNADWPLGAPKYS